MNRRGFVALASGLLIPQAAFARQLRKADDLAAPFAEFPFATALADFDFQRQLYFWGGAAKRTADFTSFTVGAGSITSLGLLPASDTAITITMAAVGTPASLIARVVPTATPGANARPVEIHDATANNAIRFLQLTTALHQGNIVSGGATQSAVSGAYTLGARNGFGMSWQSNLQRTVYANSTSGMFFKGAEDTALTVPTVTTIALGKGLANNTQYSGYVQRVVLFAAALDYPDLSRLVLGVAV
jgi:hypothetical protein